MILWIIGFNYIIIIKKHIIKIAEEKSIGKKQTDELAVMVDTFSPLKLTKAAIELSDGKYHRSWI